MPKSSPVITPENKKLKIKVKNLQKSLQVAQSGVEFWKAKYNIANEYLGKVRVHSSHRERERQPSTRLSALPYWWMYRKWNNRLSLIDCFFGEKRLNCFF